MWLNSTLKIWITFLLACLLTVGCTQTAVQKTATLVKTPLFELEYAFTQADQHPEKKLIEIINRAKSSLDIAIYSLTKKDIIEALLSAQRRGVTIRVITDQQEARSKSQARALTLLIDAGIPIKENTHKGLMHLKVTIADQAVITTGSYNYTQAASTSNDEVFLAISNPNLAKAWDIQFVEMWEDTENFTILDEK
jgi:phosphatidylserine/phosphatidylglycerophosphate/cardiolipin synthase-like enzyme